MSYGARVALILICVFILGVLAYNCFRQSFSKESRDILNYEIKTDLKHEVVLFENPLGIKNDKNTDSNLSELVNDISNDIHYEYITGDDVDVDITYYVDVKMSLAKATNNILKFCKKGPAIF